MISIAHIKLFEITEINLSMFMETLIYLILQMELFTDTDINDKRGTPLNDLLVDVQNSSEKKNKHR